MNTTNVSSTTSQNQPAAIQDLCTAAAIGVLVLALFTFLLSMVPSYREGTGTTSAFVPSAGVLDAKIWISSETSGSHSYLRLNDEDTSVITYGNDDIRNVIVPLFESRNKVRVLSWSEDRRVSAKGKSYTRGIILEHEPLR